MPLPLRGPRAVSPTPAGLEFPHFAETVLAGEAELRAHLPAVAPARQTARGDGTTPGEDFVPGLLAAFAQGQPELSTRLHIMNSQAVEKCVLRSRCDVGITGRPPAPGLPRSEAVGGDEIVLAVEPDHPWHDRAEVPLDTLRPQTVIERGEGSKTRGTVEMALRGIAPRRTVLTVSTRRLVACPSGRERTRRRKRPAHRPPLRRHILLVPPPQPAAKALAFAAFARLQAGVCENLGAPPAVL